MSEKTRLTPLLADTTYVYTLVIKMASQEDLLHMLCRQVGGSVWFSPALPFNLIEPTSPVLCPTLSITHQPLRLCH